MIFSMMKRTRVEINLKKVNMDIALKETAILLLIHLSDSLLLFIIVFIYQPILCIFYSFSL